MVRPQRSKDKGRRERGSALTWALFFVVVVSGMIVSHTIYLAANRRDMDVRFRQSALSTSFARSGALDALGWFQKQGVQPVLNFTPRRETEANPPIEDTIDPTLGLVREFEIRGGLWGRYEIRKTEVADVSELRGLTKGSGSVWDITARGYLYQRRDAGAPFDSGANRIVAMTSLRTELRGIAMVAPSQATICVSRPDQLEVGPYAVIDGGSRPAVAHPTGVLPVAATLVGLLLGAPAVQAVSGYDDTPRKVFKMGLEELGPMADVMIKQDDVYVDPITLLADGYARIKSKVADYSVIFSGKDLRLDNTRPLKGKVLLVVRGNLDVPGGGANRAGGILYVTGDASIEGPFAFRGIVIVGGRLKLGQTGAGKVQISYDSSVLDSLRDRIGRYRFARAFSVGTGTSGPDLAGSEAGAAPK